MPQNRQIHLDNRPQGEATASNFKLVTAETPALQDGQVAFTVTREFNGNKVHLSLVPNPEPLLAPPARGNWVELWSSEDPRYSGDGLAPFVDDAHLIDDPGLIDVHRAEIGHAFRPHAAAMLRADSSGVASELIVIDGASTDGTRERLAARLVLGAFHLELDVERAIGLPE